MSSPVTFEQLVAISNDLMLAPSLLSPEQQRGIAVVKAKAEQRKQVAPYEAQLVLGTYRSLVERLPKLIEDLVLAEKLLEPAEIQVLAALRGKDVKLITKDEVRAVFAIFQKVRTMSSGALRKLEELTQNMVAVLSTVDQETLVTIGMKIDMGSPLTADDVAQITRIHREFKEGFGGYTF